MNDWFELTVSYQGSQKVLEVRLVQQGYLHKTEVLIEGISVLFEPDKERNYRALVTIEQLGKHKPLETVLLQAIAGQLHGLLDR